MKDNHPRIPVILAFVLLTVAVIWAALYGTTDNDASLFSDASTSRSSDLSNSEEIDTSALTANQQSLVAELEKLNQRAKALSELNLDDEIAQADALIAKINRLIGDVGLTESLAEERRQLLLERQAELQKRLDALPQNGTPLTR
ncbi:MAG: hypothetical protein ABW090_17480 [Sedimenticola sp.]